MTIWRARRPKRVKAWLREHYAAEPDRLEPLILCGFGRAELNNLCNENIASGPTLAGTVRLASGMTDEGTPGRWRFTSHAKRRQAEGRNWLHDRRNWDVIQAEEPAERDGESTICSALPCVVPCQRGHLNVIDEDVLRG